MKLHYFILYMSDFCWQVNLKTEESIINTCTSNDLQNIWFNSDIGMANKTDLLSDIQQVSYNQTCQIELHYRKNNNNNN